jgi:hypothetical protein
MQKEITIDGVVGTWTPKVEEKVITEYINDFIFTAGKYHPSTEKANEASTSNRIGMTERKRIGNKIISVRLMDESEYK